ncbi:MAG: RNA-directed DNA polymerase [Candidatus Xenobiia bacterium LiM19]
MDLIKEEFVLVQAWKKTISYIRSHNWYADTLALDCTAANLPDFLKELADKLQSPLKWQNGPLRIVPAPKSQQWKIHSERTGQWEPIGKCRLRPLAHVNLKDQVITTAILMCLADRVESNQGDPRTSIKDSESRKKVVSYGNRLFCDEHDGMLHHRWGSTKLYRGYFQDYRYFLSRPELVAEEIESKIDSDMRVIIVHSDLMQFYDRVHPSLLADKIKALKMPSDDPQFFEFIYHILSWKWDARDKHEVDCYVKESKLKDFSNVALPQGLVASGFFANIVLLDFDRELCNNIEHEIEPGICLYDACRYVDDIRLVLSVNKKYTISDIEKIVIKWLKKLLHHNANNLLPSEEKTIASFYRDEERPIVKQSRKMERIQHAISGGFDAIGGEEILNTIQSLVRSQLRYSKDRTSETNWSLAPIPDVRDETAARFAASRYRSTYRSLRPLLEDKKESKEICDDLDRENSVNYSHKKLTQAELDDDAMVFAMGLIENWVKDPSNVRLLRIGLDLWPAADILEYIFSLLRPCIEKGGKRKSPRRIAWYCLAEIFRAGATETGFVKDNESLPDRVNIEEYRTVLLKEAERLASLPQATIPWYLRQQVLLFLAVKSPECAPVFRSRLNIEIKRYCELIRFLRGEVPNINDRDFATYAILSRRSFLDKEQSIKLVSPHLTDNKATLIAERDPSFGFELLDAHPDIAKRTSIHLQTDLCISWKKTEQGWITLAELVLNGEETLRSEMNLLRFAAKYIEKWHSDRIIEAITPNDVEICIKKQRTSKNPIQDVRIPTKKMSSGSFLYRPPGWCPKENLWRFQLGYLLRFILTAHHDYTRPVRNTSWKEGTVNYRIPESHWYQRLYGLYHGHSTFGADWLPITDWTEKFLFALMRWPGCKPSEFSEWVEKGIKETSRHIEERIKDLKGLYGKMSKLLILPLTAHFPEKLTTSRPLRICVVQTVIPDYEDFKTDDLSLSDKNIRKSHRNHLSAALAAVEQMLHLRETHKNKGGRLDLLILPELSVHPRDVETHLVPFARAHRAIVLAGLTYERLFPDTPMINSALWLIPVWTKELGLQILRFRQGKCHLAPEEEKKNNQSKVLMEFRPCQWLVGYKWDPSDSNRHLWLTASVCYDATDIRLAADLRERSDIFIIPALNKDVNTFDQMSMALHYHMFQMVIIANNGGFGGSNAYVPYHESFRKQIFHLHGQPQASIAFLEIDKIDEFINRCSPQSVCNSDEADNPKPVWKNPPAGMSER